MGHDRAAKVGGELIKTIGRIVHDEIRDPRIGFVTITRIELSDDLKFGRVFFSVIGSEKQKKDSLIGLGRAVPYVRKLLSQQMRLRYVPELEFHFDEAIEHSIHIQEVLEKLKEDGDVSE